ncbi:hypothetical protein, partial [Schleiferilactobacillus harbinensis]|uniref:hypothetical protein n=1 Tax=Schleiferilactobacillus harbinensis TaxID=304207 RepID=UPI0021A2CB69
PSTSLQRDLDGIFRDRYLQGWLRVGLFQHPPRLAQFFGDSVALTLHRNAYGGITTTVVFRPRYQKGEEQHDRHDPGR